MKLVVDVGLGSNLGWLNFQQLDVVMVEFFMTFFSSPIKYNSAA
jgi:hypothetical protein